MEAPEVTGGTYLWSGAPAAPACGRAVSAVHRLCVKEVQDGHERDEGRLRREDGSPGGGVGREAEADEGEGGEGCRPGTPRVPAEARPGEGGREARAGAPEARRAEGRGRGALGSFEVRRGRRLERAEEDRGFDENRVGAPGDHFSCLLRGSRAKTRRHVASHPRPPARRPTRRTPRSPLQRRGNGTCAGGSEPAAERRASAPPGTKIAHRAVSERPSRLAGGRVRRRRRPAHHYALRFHGAAARRPDAAL